MNVSHCLSFEWLPKGFGRLSNLEVFMGFRPARSSQIKGSRIGELKNLANLRRLSLQLIGVDQIEDNEVTALVKLQELQYLSMAFFDSDGRNLIT